MDRAAISSAVSFGASDGVIDCQWASAPLTVSVIPGSGCTAKAQYSTTPGAAGNPGAANWFDWPAGAVASQSSDVLVSPVTAIRFQRVSGSVNCTGEVAS